MNMEPILKQPDEIKKKMSLGEFVENHQKKLSVLGVFAALTLFGFNLPVPEIGRYLSFATLGITTLLIIEVFRCFPKDLEKEAEMPLILFYGLLIFIGLAIIFNWLLAYKEVWSMAMPMVLLLPTAIIYFYLFKTAFEYLEKRESTKRLLYNNFTKKVSELVRKYSRYFIIRFIIYMFFVVIILVPSWVVSSIVSFYVVKGLNKFDEKPTALVNTNNVVFTTNTIVVTNIVFRNLATVTNQIEQSIIEPPKQLNADTGAKGSEKYNWGDYFSKVFPIALGAFLAWIAGLIAFNRQRTVGARDAFLIFIETKKMEIPSNNGFQSYFLSVREKIPFEYAKLNPFLSPRKKLKYKQAWESFYHIKFNSLQDEFESDFKNDLHAALEEASNMPATPIVKPSVILSQCLDNLSKSIT